MCLSSSTLLHSLIQFYPEDEGLLGETCIPELKNSITCIQQTAIPLVMFLSFFSFYN